MRTTVFVSVLAAALVTTAAGAALAESNRLNVPANQWKSTAEIKDQLTAAGYTVQEIEVDDGAYEVDVVDKDGVRIELHVHPATGDILRGYDD